MYNIKKIQDYYNNYKNMKNKKENHNINNKKKILFQIFKIINKKIIIIIHLEN